MKCGMCDNETKRESGLCEKCEGEHVEEMKKQLEDDLNDYYASIF